MAVKEWLDAKAQCNLAGNVLGLIREENVIVLNHMQHYTQWRSSPQHTHAHKQRNILFYVQGNENKDWQLLSPSASNNKLLAIVEFWFKYLSKSDIKILILSSEKIIVSWENKKFHQTGKKKKIPIVYFLKKMYFEHELSCAVLSCSVMSNSATPWTVAC